MHHPEYSSIIAHERQKQYQADAGRRRLARPALRGRSWFRSR
jgi:hypothetical protein